MGVVRLSGTGKSVQFISDDGTVYFTSVHFLKGILDKTQKSNLVVLSKFPDKVAEDRFPVSQVWNPSKGVREDGESRSGDAFSQKSLKERKSKIKGDFVL